ncbi:hypothetical protein ASG88_15230 [Nocardioides sp. Soil777]|uniref:hypothetical protein n=1 Tax=Nocardioides sp. Soil777 TaxID=1736409 RepID=UPI0007031FF2|nr:hypothetical protein [Nocardioides sp. Soil777]KRE99085.1 hypothetical protein ASG88_15230 [Nocardioides sp. Soil777]
MKQRPTAPSVTRVDRWRYRSAVHAARVLNSVGRHDAVIDRPTVGDRPRARFGAGRPSTS